MITVMEQTDVTDGSVPGQRSPSDAPLVVVQSTSSSTAEVSPITIRDGQLTRLVFIPELVDQEHNQEACVRGTFAYQKKRKAEPWEDIASIKLNQLRSGEGVRLELG